MGFSTELQGQASHEALLRLQETEIQLLEVVKRCVVQRVKCDRDYASAISAMLVTAHKFDNAEFETPTFQAWQTIVREMSSLVKLLQENIQTLSTLTLDRLTRLISEKQEAKRFYTSERGRLQARYTQLKADLARSQTEYPKLTGRVTMEKAKYEELLSKGRPCGKFDDASSRYQRSSLKLHQLHNEYVLLIKETQLHGRHYCTTTLPALLQLQQDSQHTAVTHSKDILHQFVQTTDLSAQGFISCSQQIYRSINAINASGEYDSFLNTHRTDPLPIEKFEFDSTFLEVYKGRLKENEIAVDDFTIDSIQLKLGSLERDVASCGQRIESKQTELSEVDTSLTDLPPANEWTDAIKDMFSAQKKKQRVLLCEMTGLKCVKETLDALSHMVQAPLDSLGGHPPPVALQITSLDPTDAPSTPVSGGHPLTGLRGAFSNIKTALAHKNPFRRTADAEPPPSLPSRHFLETAGGGVENGQQEVPPCSGGLGAGAEDNLPRVPSASDGYQLCGFKDATVKGVTTAQSSSLEEQLWFHGVMPREEVQRLLVDRGDFVVRESRNRRTGETQFVLSVMWSGHKHFIIQGHEGCWRLEGETFDTIQTLVEQQLECGLPVTKRSEVVLSKAVIREPWELNNDDIVLSHKIGNGNFGEVYRGIFKPKELEVAVKTCHETLSDDAKKKFLQEGRILKQYDHPNIVKFIGIAARRQPVMIVMEYVPGGSLLIFLRKQGSKQTKRQLIQMCVDAAAGMAYLENANCIHRDVAARNCLVGAENIVKISDFGMSREEEEYTVSSGMKQIPIKWTAPEALNYGTYTWACDVWSFGILMWEVFAFGAAPYPGLPNSKAKEEVDEGYRMSAPAGTPPPAYGLMLKCWEYEPSGRPHFNTILGELEGMRDSL